MTTEDLYTILGVTRSCTLKDIRHQFKSLSRKYHPDKTRGAEELYKKIVLAYSILSDPVLRDEYDGYKEVRDFKTLKESSKKPIDIDLKALEKQHKTEIESRHTELLRGYRERSLGSLTKERSDTMRPQDGDLRQPIKTQKQCIVPRAKDPLAIVALPEKYQVLENLGEMYYRGKEDQTMIDYTSDVTREEWTRAEHEISTLPPLQQRIQQRMNTPVGGEYLLTRLV